VGRSTCSTGIAEGEASGDLEQSQALLKGAYSDVEKAAEAGEITSTVEGDVTDSLDYVRDGDGKFVKAKPGTVPPSAFITLIEEKKSALKQILAAA